MENKIEHVEDEKVYCYTYDSLVRELSKKMVVNEERLLSEDGEETIGGHENIFNWIKAIDFEEGKTPAIEATFSSDGGKKTVRVDTEKQTPVGSLEEMVSKEDLLYSMALTEAKMKVVSAIAEEVYPAVAFQISDYRNKMGKMRDEILGNKSQTSNFNEVMHGALSRKNIASIMVIGSMVMSSCGVVVETGTVKPTETLANPAMIETLTPPTETGTENPTAAAVTVIPTETATEMPTITLTPEPTATATEMPTPTKEKSLIEGNIFFDPQSKEDFKEVVLSPSPLDEPEKFALWQEEYLKLVKDKMADFEGQAIDRQVAISYLNELKYSSTEWLVISAYKFKWRGQEILTKTFLYQDQQENLIPVSLTYAPENSWFFDGQILYSGHVPFRYETPPAADELRLLNTLFSYGGDLKKDMEKKRKPEEVFMEEYLGNDVSDETKTIIMNIWGNRATKEDIDSFSKMRFVLWMFTKF